MEWMYKGREVADKDLEGQFGFVYVIENLVTGKKYIGKKLLTKAHSRMVKKKRKKSRIESDWRTYYGSNAVLQEDVIIQGEECFSREILRFCKTRGSCNYYEAKEQFAVDAILSKDYYNSWISVRVASDHVK